MDFQDHQHNERCREDLDACSIAVGLGHFTYAVSFWLEAQREHEFELRMQEIEQKIKFR